MTDHINQSDKKALTSLAGILTHLEKFQMLQQDFGVDLSTAAMSSYSDEYLKNELVTQAINQESIGWFMHEIQYSKIHDFTMWVAQNSSEYVSLCQVLYMSNKTPIGTAKKEQMEKLPKLLTESLEMKGLYDLSQDMGIDWQKLEGDTEIERAKGIIAKCTEPAQFEKLFQAFSKLSKTSIPSEMKAALAG